jgi:hypothetical protein
MKSEPSPRKEGTMQHQLSITYGATRDQQPFDPQIHLMAQTDVGGFEEDGLPDSVKGTLLQVVPEQLVKKVKAHDEVCVELGGQSYRFDSLEPGGAFELRRC